MPGHAGLSTGESQREHSEPERAQERPETHKASLEHAQSPHTHVRGVSKTGKQRKVMMMIETFEGNGASLFIPQRRQGW